MDFICLDCLEEITNPPDTCPSCLSPRLQQINYTDLSAFTPENLAEAGWVLKSTTTFDDDGNIIDYKEV